MDYIVNLLKDNNFDILYQNEDKDFAVYKNENPVCIRIICKKINIRYIKMRFNIINNFSPIKKESKNIQTIELQVAENNDNQDIENTDKSYDVYVDFSGSEGPFLYLNDTIYNKLFINVNKFYINIFYLIIFIYNYKFF